MSRRARTPSGELIERGLVDGLTVHDAAGRCLYASPTFEALLGYPAEELLGRTPARAAVHRDDVDALVAAQAEALRTGAPWRLLYRARRHDGAFIWVESAGRAVPTDEGTRLVVVTREAAPSTSLRHGVAEERQVAQRIKELTARQQRFLTTISHWAREPLTAVVGMAELLRRRGDDLDREERRALTERLHANADQLRDLLEEATEADELSRADVVVQRRVVDVAQLVDAAVAEVASEGRAVEVEVDHDLHAVVDRGKVHRILQILLRNARQHAGPDATIRVTARATTDALELLVDDDGPGIPPEDRAVVFEPFTHREPDATDAGTGLGLYLVAELVALHRGRVRAEEAPGGGARFRVTLPRPRADARVAAAEGDHGRATAALAPEAQRFVTQLLTTLRDRTGMGLVYLSVLDRTNQHILAVAGDKEVAGIEAGLRIPIEETYCARMVADELDHVVGDTATHPVTAGLPATADGLACWIGVPVHLPSGHVLGSLCCADDTARPGLSQAAADELRSFADILGGQLAMEGFLARSPLDATGRVAAALTSPGAITPVYQPIVDLETGTVAGVEALSRFPGHDRVTDLWFADAARAGLLLDLEVHAAEQSLAALDTLPDDVYLTINVSPATVRSRELGALLAEAPLDRIVLEITEHAAVDNYRPLVDALDPHRDHDLRIAVDDVGTGHAGLGHLVRLRPDIIKVDRSIVDTLDTDPAHAAAVGGIVRMADHLDATLVAEGIERQATLHAVRDVGFTHAQGYLLAPPAATLDVDAVSSRVQGLVASA